MKLETFRIGINHYENETHIVEIHWDKRRHNFEARLPEGLRDLGHTLYNNTYEDLIKDLYAYRDRVFLHRTSANRGNKYIYLYFSFNFPKDSKIGEELKKHCGDDEFEFMGTRMKVNSSLVSVWGYTAGISFNYKIYEERDYNGKMYYYSDTGVIQPFVSDEYKIRLEWTLERQLFFDTLMLDIQVLSSKLYNFIFQQDKLIERIDQYVQNNIKLIGE